MEYQISVLISTYNDRQFVEKKLAEILRQTLFSRAEFIFIETASPTRERELLQPFCDEHPNCRLITLDERKTLYEAWNIGWDAAQAPLLCYSAMDDAMHPRLLEFVVASMKNKKIQVCTVLAARQPINGQWNDWSSDRIRKLRLVRMPGAFTAWRSKLQDTIGQFDGRFAIAGDRDFWARIVRARIPFKVIPKILYFYTKRPEQLSKSPKNGPIYRHERELAAQKPYPLDWPRSWKWRFAWLKFLRSLLPGKFIVSDLGAPEVHWKPALLKPFEELPVADAIAQATTVEPAFAISAGVNNAVDNSNLPAR